MRRSIRIAALAALAATLASPALAQTVKVTPILILPIIIVGGIFTGIFTVTESAAVGTAYTIIVGVLLKPRLRIKDIYDATVYSAVISSVAGMLARPPIILPIGVRAAPRM